MARSLLDILTGRGKDPDFADPAGLAAAENTGLKLSFLHIPTATVVEFKAYITDFSDNYDSNWNDENVYGRMDPIMTFQNTSRQVQVSWDVVAANRHEAKSNLRRCSLLIQMLYPVYHKEGFYSTMIAPPLLKVKYGNFIQSAETPGGDVTMSGLVCTPNGLSYKPNFDAGLVGEGNGSRMYPKVVSLSCVLNILHDHRGPGWTVPGAGPAVDFPYGEKTNNQPLKYHKGAKDVTGIPAVTKQGRKSLGFAANPKDNSRKNIPERNAAAGGALTNHPEYENVPTYEGYWPERDD